MDSANKNTIADRWQKYKNRIIDVIKQLSWKDNKVKVFFMHDNDDDKANESLKLTCDYFQEQLTKTISNGNLEIVKEAIYDQGLSFDWFIATLFWPKESLECTTIQDKKKLAKKVVAEYQIKQEKYWSKIIKSNNWEELTTPSNISYRNFLRQKNWECHKMQSRYWEIVDAILKIVIDDQHNERE